MSIELFKGMNLLEFTDKFKDDESCREYLAHHKWSLGFTCRKCGCTQALNTSRKHIKQCKSCLDLESSTAGTLFHKLKFSLRKAFVMVYTMSSTSKGSSSHNFSKTLDINKNTARP
jgi:Transposase zinc-ribbon domain